MNELVYLPSLVVSLVVGVMGWLLKRSIDALDRRLEGQDSKLEQLVGKDTALEVQLVEIRVRLAHVEREVGALNRARDCRCPSGA